MAPTSIDAYRQRITTWSERLRFHLLQLKAKSGANTTADDSATTQQLIGEVVQALEHIQRDIWTEVDTLNRHYQREINDAPFWRRAILHRKQTTDEAAYREVTQLIEQVLLAASNIRDTMTLASTPMPVKSQPDEQTSPEPVADIEAKPAPQTSEPDFDSPMMQQKILQQELRRVADQWKWRLDTTHKLLESPTLSPERIAYIRGIQTTAWNVLQDIAALLDDDSLTI